MSEFILTKAGLCKGLNRGVLLGRPLGYLIFSRMALIGDLYTNIFQWVLGANLDYWGHG